METESSVRFFDAQFERQIRDADLVLNPFERRALPHLSGDLLDFGCGLGNLALAAARLGCKVVALDASHVAIGHLRKVAAAESLPLCAAEADLRTHVPAGMFDAVVCIGLLMFFDCPTAMTQLGRLQQLVRPGGLAVVNVLVEGTTYLDMFDPSGHCLFARGQLDACFAGWHILSSEREDFPAPNQTVKAFCTIIARKP